MKMYLGLDTSMLHKHPGIGSETTAGTANVSINLKDLFNAARDHQRRRDSLLHRQQNTVLGLDANGSRAELLGGSLTGHQCSQSIP